RECGELAARRSFACHVARALPGWAGGRGTDRPCDQRRSRAVVAGTADAPALRSPSWRGLAAAKWGCSYLGGHRDRGRRRVVGDAPEPEGAAFQLFAASRAR